MAASSIVPFVDVRSVITLARRESERLAERLTRDVPALFLRTPSELAARGVEMVGVVEHQVSKAAAQVLRRLSAATQSEIDELGRRVALLEKRLKSVERARRKARRPTL